MGDQEIYRVVDQYEITTYALMASKTEAANLARLLTEFIAPAKVITHRLYESAAECIELSESNHGKMMRRVIPKDRYWKVKNPQDVNGGFGESAGAGWR